MLFDPCRETCGGRKSAVRLRQRGKDKPHLTPEQKRAARRVGELGRVYYHQHPNGLPANALGVKYALYMLRTMAFLPDDRREEWLERHAPWMDAATRDYLMSFGPYWYSPRSLGQHLELDQHTRKDLWAWSIRPCDLSDDEWKALKSGNARTRQEKRRRKKGQKPHAESLSRTKPWEAEGISRRTWERRRRKAVDADSSRPSLYLNPRDESATRPGALDTAEPVESAAQAASVSLAPARKDADQPLRSRPGPQALRLTPSSPSQIRKDARQRRRLRSKPQALGLTSSSTSLNSQNTVELRRSHRANGQHSEHAARLERCDGPVPRPHPAAIEAMP
jgi:hypothetical protein